MKTDVAKFHGWTVTQLEKLSTKQLMAVRKASYHIIRCSHCEFDCGALEDNDKLFNKNQFELADNVKKVLSKREHVPSKREGSALRRAAVKRKS